MKSFARLCDNIPKGNQCVQDNKLVTCYESCTQDFCNGGNPGPHYLRTINYANDDDVGKWNESEEEANVKDVAMGASMKSVYRYNNLEASRGFQEPAMEDGNLISPTSHLPENIQRIIQAHRKNLAGGTSGGPRWTDGTDIAEDADGEDNDEKNADYEDDSLKIVAYRGVTENRNADADVENLADEKSRTRPSQKVNSLSLDDDLEASGSQPGSMISAFSSKFVKRPVAKMVATTDESTEEGNYVNAEDADFRGEKEAKKDHADAVRQSVGMVMSHHPSYYISSSENNEKNSKDGKNEESVDVTPSVQNPTKTSAGPPSPKFTSSPSTNSKHTSSPRFASTSTREEETDFGKPPKISKFMSTGLHDESAVEHSPRSSLTPTFASRNPTKPLTGFSKPSTNPSSHFIASGLQSSPRGVFPTPRHALHASVGSQGYRSVAPKSHSTGRSSTHLQAPMNPSVSILPPISSYRYPINRPNVAMTTARENAGGFSARSPAYLYPSLPLVSDQTPVRRVQPPTVFNHTLSMMVMPDLPRPKPYSGLPRDHNDINFQRGSDAPFPGDYTLNANDLRADAPGNDVVGRVKDESEDVGPELEYLMMMQKSHFTDGPGGKLTSDYDAAFVESGYTRDSFDNLVTAFRQHPENRYPSSEEKADTQAEPEKENASAESQGESLESAKPTIFGEQSDENITQGNALDTVVDARHENSSASGNETQSAPETDKREPIVVWSRSQSKPKSSDKEDRTTETYSTINHSIVITDAPLTIKSHSQKERAKSTDSRKNKFMRQPPKTIRGSNAVSKTASRSGKRRPVKTTFKDNLSSDTDLKSVVSAPPSTTGRNTIMRAKTTISSKEKSQIITITKASGVGAVEITSLSTKSSNSASSELDSLTVGAKVDDVTKTTVTTRLDGVGAAAASKPKQVLQSSTVASGMMELANSVKPEHNSEMSLGETSAIYVSTTEAKLSPTIAFPSTRALKSPQIPPTPTPSGSSSRSPPGTSSTQTTAASSGTSAVQNSTANPTAASEDITGLRDVRLTNSSQSHSDDRGEESGSDEVHTNANDRLPHSRREDQKHVKPFAAEPTRHSTKNSSTSTMPASTVQPTRSYVLEGTVKTSTSLNGLSGNNASDPTTTVTTTRTSTTYSSSDQQQGAHPQTVYPKTTQFVNLPKPATAGSSRRIPPRVNRYQAPRLQLRKSSSSLLTLNSKGRQVMDSFGHVHDEEEPESSGSQSVLSCRSLSVLWMLTIVCLCFPLLCT